MPLTNLILSTQIKSTVVIFMCSPTRTHLLVMIGFISAFIRYPRICKKPILASNCEKPIPASKCVFHCIRIICIELASVKVLSYLQSALFSHNAIFDETLICKVNKYCQMLISLWHVWDKILGGRQLVTERGLSTVTTPSNNWWAVLDIMIQILFLKSIVQVFYFLIKGSLIRFHICIIFFVSPHLLAY